MNQIQKELEAQATEILKADREGRGLYGKQFVTGDEYSWLTPYQLADRRRRELPTNTWHSWDGASITLAPSDSIRTRKVFQVWNPTPSYEDAHRGHSVDMVAVCDMPRCKRLITPPDTASGGWGLCWKHWHRVKYRPHMCCEFDVDGQRCAGDQYSRVGYHGPIYCTRHYLRAKRHGDPTYTSRQQKGKRKFKLCSLPDCERPHYGKGLCNPHYMRQRRNGTVASEHGVEVGARLDHPDTCTKAECDEPFYCKNLCVNHYSSMMYHKRKQVQN